MDELLAWLALPFARAFPFAAVVRDLNASGKQFAPIPLLLALDRTRALAHPAINRFLDVVLDKYDGTFANRTYLALDLLDLPDPNDVESARVRRDRLHHLLVSDIARHADTAAGDLVPDTSVRAKRVHLAERALESVPPVEPTPADDLLLAVTMLPQTRLHDERLFIRSMQAYEATFALVAACLADGSDDALTLADRALAQAAPLFSLAATLQTEAFLAFREYTQGASAMQSVNYTLIQSRLAALPETPAANAVRDRLAKWRQTHYRIAMRLLGDRPGTGSTDGAAYLDRARAA